MTTIAWLLVTPVGAHASLVASSPASGQVIGGRVEVLDLVFNEAIVEPGVTLVGPDGGEIVTSAVQPVPNHLRVQLLEALSLEGDYALTYRLVSADEDALEVTLRFSYDSDALPPAQIVSEVVDIGGTGMKRWLLVAGLSIIVVGLALRVALSTKRLRSARHN